MKKSVLVLLFQEGFRLSLARSICEAAFIVWLKAFIPNLHVQSKLVKRKQDPFSKQKVYAMIVF